MPRRATRRRDVQARQLPAAVATDVATCPTCPRRCGLLARQLSEVWRFSQSSVCPLGPGGSSCTFWVQWASFTVQWPFIFATYSAYASSFLSTRRGVLLLDSHRGDFTRTVSEMKMGTSMSLPTNPQRSHARRLKYTPHAPTQATF